MWVYSASLLSRTNPAGQLLKEEAMHGLEVEFVLFNCLDCKPSQSTLQAITAVAAIVDTFLVLDELQIKQKNVYIHNVKYINTYFCERISQNRTSHAETYSLPQEIFLNKRNTAGRSCITYKEHLQTVIVFYFKRRWKMCISYY